MGCLLCGVYLPAQAQHKLKTKTGKSIRSSSSHRVISSKASAPLSARAVHAQLKSSQNSPAQVSGAYEKAPLVQLQALALLREQIGQLQNPLTSLEQRHPFVLSTFQLRDQIGAYSGGLFTTHGEVYGVIAAHIIEGRDDLLGRYFSAEFYHQGAFISIPAEVVLINPMLDIALVRFSWETAREKGLKKQDLKPLKLAKTLPQFGQQIAYHGFIGDHYVVDMNNRLVTQSLPLTLRTTMPWPRCYRPGLCGGWMTELQQEYALGTHIGSSESALDEKDDVGFATPAWLLEVMVTAYENGGEAYFPVEVDGRILAQLRADEYISFITLYDKQENEIWNGKADKHFSYRFITNLIKMYQPHVLQFTLGRVKWNEQKPLLLEDNASVRNVRYEFLPDEEE